MAITLPERQPSKDIPYVGGERYDIGDIIIDFHPSDVQEHYFVSPLEIITFPVGDPLKVFCAFDTDIIKINQVSNRTLGFALEGASIFAHTSLRKHNVRQIAVNYPTSTRLELQEMMQIKPSTLVTDNHESNAPMTTLALSHLFQQFVASGFRGGKIVAESLLSLAIVHAIEVASASRIKDASKRPYKMDAVKLSRTLEFVEENLASNIGLTEIAAIANISNYHFLRCFKESMGMPPYAYLLSRRVERAKRLLNQNRLTIFNIALLCGFNSQSHFSTLFKRFTGLTPSQYRAQQLR